MRGFVLVATAGAAIGLAALSARPALAADIRIKDCRRQRLRGGPICSVAAAWPRLGGKRG